MVQLTPYADCSAQERADCIAQLGAGLSAQHREALAVVAEADRRGDWREDGARDMAAWLCGRLGLARHAAEWVRVAHALESLPECALAYAEGRLSWDQLRPLTLFATPERDLELAAQAPGWSAASLEAMARRAQRVSREQAEREQDRRSLRMWNGRDGFRLSALMPVADGAVVRTALERVGEELARERERAGLPPEPRHSLLSDALHMVTSNRLASDADPDRACVVVHVDAEALAGRSQDGSEGGATLEGDVPVHVEMARRLACDCRMEFVAEGPDGVALGVGRARRTIPAWLLRQLRRRDCGRCRFPGCRNRVWLHAHHIRAWERDGRTDLDNLCLLCSAHHRLVHELGWTVRGNANRVLEFRRPDGRLVANGPPPLRPEVRDALLEAVGRPAARPRACHGPHRRTAAVQPAAP
jgi:Domain of unknown function (DUF222)/HNH endonuclease